MKEYPGIIVGRNPIPVDPEILAMVKEHQDNFNSETASKLILHNRHNSTTTVYYLLLKRFLRKGGVSIADITKYNPEDFKPQHPN